MAEQWVHCVQAVSAVTDERFVINNLEILEPVIGPDCDRVIIGIACY